MEINVIENTRSQIAEVGRWMYTRRLTDSAGGNLSARAGDCICITPRYAGSKYHWDLRPEQVLVVEPDGHKLSGEGEISREARVHLKLYAQYSSAQAVVHGHAQNALAFCVSGKVLPPVLEDTLKFGSIPVCEFAPAHSPILAENICRAFAGQEKRMQQQAAAVLAPWHGVFVAGKDLLAAYDALERIDQNARLALLLELLDPDRSGAVEQASQQLALVMQAFIE